MLVQERNMFRCLVTTCISVCSLSGWASAQLTRRTLDQAATFPAVQNCQVLDNVARFSNNPAAIPYFAMITGGTAQATDAGSATALVFPNYLLGSTGHAIWSGQYGPKVSSTIQENWNITPVTDPDKLRRMRCAYQYLIQGQPTACASCAGCPEWLDCLKQMQDFFCPDGCKRHPDGSIVDPTNCDECLECYLPRGWYYLGCKHDVPKTACYVGHDCDTYAWVTAEGLDGLSRFTLAIIELAAKSLPRDEVVVRRIYKGDWVHGQAPVRTEVDSKETARPPADAREAGDYQLRRPPKTTDVIPVVPQPLGILPVPSPE
jgi:hypothetical protein